MVMAGIFLAVVVSYEKKSIDHIFDGIPIYMDSACARFSCSKN